MPGGIEMAVSEINKTLAAALHSARALSNQTLVRPREAAAMLGISRKHLYALADQPNFPKRIHVSDRAVGWRIADLEAWIDSKAEGGV
jgi:prophage regulatory protein